MGMGIVSSKHHRGTGLLWDGPETSSLIVSFRFVATFPLAKNAKTSFNAKR